jgi:hypothetical protein
MNFWNIKQIIDLGKRKKSLNSAVPILAHRLWHDGLVAHGVSQAERREQTEAACPTHSEN